MGALGRGAFVFYRYLALPLSGALFGWRSNGTAGTRNRVYAGYTGDFADIEGILLLKPWGFPKTNRVSGKARKTRYRLKLPDGANQLFVRFVATISITAAIAAL
jgi:hypothetical protein